MLLEIVHAAECGKMHTHKVIEVIGKHIRFNKGTTKGDISESIKTPLFKDKSLLN